MMIRRRVVSSAVSITFITLQSTMAWTVSEEDVASSPVVEKKVPVVVKQELKSSKAIQRKKSMEIVIDEEGHRAAELTSTPSPKKKSTALLSEALVREYFARNNMTDLLESFNSEKPKTKSSISSSSKLVSYLGISEQYKKNSSSKKQYKSVLEVLVLVTTPPAEKKKKPRLSISTVIEAPPSPKEESSPVAQNITIGRPGATPRNINALLGKPGSTPKLSNSDRKAFGFDDFETEVTDKIEDDGSTPAIVTSTILSTKSILKKPENKKQSGRRVTFSGFSENFFCRHTPPQMSIASSVKAALEIKENLDNDPNFEKVSDEKKEQYIELSSSNVAKYKLGSFVKNLGGDGSISGVITKVYGSKQCGMGGPGTIIIDTFATSNAEEKKDSVSELEAALEAELLSVSSTPSVSPMSSVSVPCDNDDEILQDLLKDTSDIETNSAAKSVKFQSTVLSHDDDLLMEELLMT